MAPDELVETIVNAARRRNAEELGAFLDGMCGADGELRRRVESRLTHAADGVIRLSALPAADTSPSASPYLSGRRVGSYQIDALIGKGGMGEVYRARDTRLGRIVALKVLPAKFTADAERLARFESEARMLASLNHPHIGAIFGLEDAAGIPALVLEFVDGETLAERLRRGPIALHDALRIADQIADALDAAHRKGIIHRDLKPANVKVTPDGVVKVLDFGLAKAAGCGVISPQDLSQSPTMALDATRVGTILGTVPYMSPEQARGLPVDTRTDIWAFGCVLYEMLTAQPAFHGETVAETVTAILEREPDWKRLPSSTPS